jgi:hypothetical protein
MRNSLKLTVLALTLCTITAVSVRANQAKVRKETVRFPTTVMVNGTEVKAGTYKVQFDEQSGELTILKGSNVVAKTTAHLQKRESKAKQTSITTETSAGGDQLIRIALGGEEEDIVIGG